MSHYSWPSHWSTLRSAGRLQFSRSPITGLWRAALPELGVEVFAKEMSGLTAKIAPHIARLPCAPEVQRINGHDHEPLPASRNLLPRR